MYNDFKIKTRMKKNKKSNQHSQLFSLKREILFIVLCLFSSFYTQAQLQVKCGNTTIDEDQHAAKKGESYNDSEHTSFVNDPNKLTVTSNFAYVIPVVFHVFANNAQNLVPVAQCQSGLDKVNEDFNAWNPDFNMIDPQFAPIASSLSINFVLAQLDPDSNPTTGVTYHPLDSGFGGINMNNVIVQYAWDNYKYMNIYIMLDLFGDGVLNNSGVAWYPDTVMSNQGIARVVYNYWYLGNTGSSIASDEFQSVLTHEFGHWLDLRHTFNGGSCVDFDGIADTPPSDVAAGGCGPNAAHCGGNINGENYMDYNATCYKMFTQGQVNWMLAALQHPARFPLWQQSNLAATGLGQYIGIKDNAVFQNITYNIKENTLYSNAEKISLYNLLGQVVFEKSNSSSILLFGIPAGIYILSLYKNGQQQFHKIIIAQ